MLRQKRQLHKAAAAWNSRLDRIAYGLIHRLGLRGVDKRAFPILSGYIPDAFFDFRFDLGIFVHPRDQLLVASLGELVALHFSEHQFPDKFILTECLVVLLELGILRDELVEFCVDFRISPEPGFLLLRLFIGD